MAIIHEKTIDEVIAALPELEPLDRQLDEATELLILISAAGFEERARDLVTQKPDIWHDLVVVTYPTNQVENQSGQDAFRRAKAKNTYSEIAYERREFWDRVCKCLSQIPENGKGYQVVVDVSGMSSYVFYPLMESIRQEVRLANLGIVYVEADKYHPHQDVWESFRDGISDLSNPLEIAELYQQKGNFESRGPSDVYASQLFPGINAEPLATQLVVVPSFGLERVKEMLAYSEGQYNLVNEEIRWLIANPPDRRKNGWRLEALLELYCAKDNPKWTPLSTRAYGETLRGLDEIWQETNLERHMVVATVGSKMQHLATYLFLCIRSEVGLVLSEPREFNATQYSDGVGPRWWLNFGPITELSRLLNECGQLEFRW